MATELSVILFIAEPSGCICALHLEENKFLRLLGQVEQGCKKRASNV